MTVAELVAQLVKYPAELEVSVGPGLGRALGVLCRGAPGPVVVTCEGADPAAPPGHDVAGDQAVE